MWEDKPKKQIGAQIIGLHIDIICSDYHSVPKSCTARMYVPGESEATRLQH